MSKPRVFEKPMGMRDILPNILEEKRTIEQRLKECCQGWGYREIMTPTLEYFDTVGVASATMEDKMFKLMDRKGNTLVLRPDMTAPIARVVASLLKEEPFPIRLMYQGNVFRRQEKEAGRNAEFPQTGVELIGDGTAEADGEVIALCVTALKEVQVPYFQIAVGHVGFIDGLLEETVKHEDIRSELKEQLVKRDYVGYRKQISQLPISAQDKERLHQLLHLKGGAEVLGRARTVVKNGKVEAALTNLVQLWEVLQSYEVIDHLMFDLTMLSHLDYYTGILFEGYADHLGFPICSGGRYDGLLSQFNRPAPATGFALKVDRLLEVAQLKPEERGENIWITFLPGQRKTAIQTASQLRRKGNKVTLQLVHSTQPSLKREGVDRYIHMEQGEMGDE
ncbi:ATP phosphoribosyltransferase regulatory subunit [Microaerobacter geothermalis]|uniref:ATP phosphoribosyltransferase regulatory subunit n=1 Tax=Microaerobacter geothermalis TaxID=674972 RepID=UPI001F217479|nr:ATP phosphoribosyltransferase regulatory subunit [Microaerobacter geothermalis]MCF6094566.1 ATP phosphoribosyltransferase regulatory subunit [Microaerobacter geothermalis]